MRRWKGESVEGDYEGNTIGQAIQNTAGRGTDVARIAERS